MKFTAIFIALIGFQVAYAYSQGSANSVHDDVSAMSATVAQPAVNSAAGAAVPMVDVPIAAPAVRLTKSQKRNRRHRAAIKRRRQEAAAAALAASAAAPGSAAPTDVDQHVVPAAESAVPVKQQEQNPTSFADFQQNYIKNTYATYGSGTTTTTTTTAIPTGKDEDLSYAEFQRKYIQSVYSQKFGDLPTTTTTTTTKLSYADFQKKYIQSTYDSYHYWMNL